MHFNPREEFTMKLLKTTLLAAALSVGLTPLVMAQAIEPGPNAQEEIQEALILAEEGDTVELAAGVFELTSTLSLDVDGVTVKGQGIDNTILSFKNQNAGSEGFAVTSNNVVLQDFAVEDAAGDAIKTKGCEGISFINIRVEWTGGPKETNGAYGLYPVACKNVLIDGCVAIGASDAGIYVGQSQDIILRNSIAKYNVAGIEIENCYRADVYNNLATKNAGGLLVFDLPNLPQQGGHNVRFFNNMSVDNDTKNFAPEGNIVGLVPTGTGLMIMANRNVEVFNNIFHGNGTANISISSYSGKGAEARKISPDYNPNPDSIHIHHNTFSNGGYKPMGMFGKMMQAAAGTESLPDIVWDGVVAEGKSPGDIKLSIHNNGTADFVNLDVSNFEKDPKSAKPSRDLTPYAEPLPPVPAVQLWEGAESTD